MILGYLKEHSEEEGHHEEGEDHAHEEGHDHMLMRFLNETDMEGDLHDDHEEEDFDSAVAWRFGLCVLCGFLIPALTALLTPTFHEPLECETCDPLVEQEKTTTKDEETADHECDDHCEHDHKEQKTPAKINWRLASSIIIGDFAHNFTDGIFVGTAFMLCDYDIAIGISLATIYHEIAQEIADFFMLTKHCNMSVPLALILNFIGGLSVMLGAIVVLAADINSLASGCILAVGGGVYINIAAVECLPRANAAQETKKDLLVSFLSFVVGVVPIGLVLLDHEHCGDHDH